MKNSRTRRSIRFQKSQYRGTTYLTMSEFFEEVSSSSVDNSPMIEVTREVMESLKTEAGGYRGGIADYFCALAGVPKWTKGWTHDCLGKKIPSNHLLQLAVYSKTTEKDAPYPMPVFSKDEVALVEDTQKFISVYFLNLFNDGYSLDFEEWLVSKSVNWEEVRKASRSLTLDMFLKSDYYQALSLALKMEVISSSRFLQLANLEILSR